MDHRFPPLQPPLPMAGRALALPTLPFAEWIAFAAMVALLALA